MDIRIGIKNGTYTSPPPNPTTSLPPIFMQAPQIHLLARPLQIARDIKPRVQLPLRPTRTEILKAAPPLLAAVARKIHIVPVLPPGLLPDERQMRRTAGPVAVDERAGHTTIGPGRTVLGEDGRREEAVRIADEIVGRGVGGRDAADPLRRHLAQHLGVICELCLDRVWHRAGCACRVRAQDPEQVGEPRRCEPQVRVRVAPFAAGLPCAAEVDGVRDDRERWLEVGVGAGRGKDRVDFPVYAIRGDDACGSEVLDGCLDVGYVGRDQSFQVAWPGREAPTAWGEGGDDGVDELWTCREASLDELDGCVADFVVLLGASKHPAEAAPVFLLQVLAELEVCFRVFK